MVLNSSLLAASSPQSPAQAILQETGVTGGLVVHVGCGDNPELAMPLQAIESFVVQGLETDDGKVSKARKVIQDAGLYGPVSVSEWDGRMLPYVDNLVNRLVISNHQSPVTRFCAPLRPAAWRCFSIRNRQLSIENGPSPGWNPATPGRIICATRSGNAVGEDRHFGPSRFTQWMDEPLYTRFHDKMSGLSAMGQTVFQRAALAPCGR